MPSRAQTLYAGMLVPRHALRSRGRKPKKKNSLTQLTFSPASPPLIAPYSSLPPIASSTMPTVHLLDYVAGNVRSLANAIEKIGYTVEWVKSPADVLKAEVTQSRRQ